MKQMKRLLKYQGERFMYYRKKAGISRRSAARYLGISPRTLAAYERGEREATIITIMHMQMLYDVSFTEITGFEDDIYDKN